MWNLGGIKIEVAAGRRIFSPSGAENCENLFFLRNRSVPENFQREIFSGGVPTESLRTHDSEYVYIGVSRTFLSVLFLPEVGRWRQKAMCQQN